MKYFCNCSSLLPGFISLYVWVVAFNIVLDTMRCAVAQLKFTAVSFKSNIMYSHTNFSWTLMNLLPKIILCRTVFEYYDRGKFTTAKKVTFTLREEIVYKDSLSYTIRLLKHPGFQYERTRNRHKFLMNRDDVMARFKCLWTVHNHREFCDSWPVFYLSETWVSQNHTVKNTFVRIPLGMGGLEFLQRKETVILFAMQDQQIRVSYLRASGSSKPTHDYHEELTSHTFWHWFLNRFVNYLEEGSIIIMDNVSYHFVTINKVKLAL
jgi:hypothetical protein